MNRCLEKSVVLTGPSASGKTTLHVCMTIHFSLVPDPVHTTRPLRVGEVSGVDVRSMSEEEYLQNFDAGAYLEDSPESAYFSGSYYGTPRAWIESTTRRDFNCFVCPTVKVARRLKEVLGGEIFWIHLSANEEVRMKRLAKRNPDMNMEDFSARVNRGSQKVDISGHDYCIDTSRLGARDIFLKAVGALFGEEEVIMHERICVES